MTKQLSNKFVCEIHEKLYLNSELSDVNFVFQANGENEKVPAHKLILATASPVFNGMFFGSLKEEGDVPERDATASAFKEFLQFFYLSSVTLSIENIDQVARLADKYDMLDCVSTSATFLESCLTPENLCWAYQLAIVIRNEQLKQFCEREIGLNALDVFQSDNFLHCDRIMLEHILKIDAMYCDETDVFDACLAWTKAACKTKSIDEYKAEHLKAQLGDCFRLIRFGAMKVEDFSNYVLSYKDMFTRDEMMDIYLTISLNLEPNVFIGKPRINPLQWYDENTLLCSLCKSSEEAHFIQISESTWFSTDKLALLGEITCAQLFTGYGSCKSINSKVSIIEIDGLTPDEYFKVAIPHSEPNCTHVKQAVDIERLHRSFEGAIIENEECVECRKIPNQYESGDDQSLWMCLKCGTNLCGRSVNKHALEHYKIPRSDSHAIVLNTNTLEIWCYDCEAYITNVDATLQRCVDFVTCELSKMSPQKPAPVRLKEKLVHTESVVLTHSSCAEIKLAKPILINPRKMYEIRFEQINHSCYHQWGWIEVDVSDILTVKFHQKPAESYTNSSGLVHSLLFNVPLL